MAKAYRVLRVSTACGARHELKPGDVVYALHKYDYGLASDDTRATGVDHISVSKSPEGDYPSWTIAERDLEEV